MKIRKALFAVLISLMLAVPAFAASGTYQGGVVTNESAVSAPPTPSDFANSGAGSNGNYYNHNTGLIQAGGGNAASNSGATAYTIDPGPASMTISHADAFTNSTATALGGALFGHPTSASNVDVVGSAAQVNQAGETGNPNANAQGWNTSSAGYQGTAGMSMSSPLIAVSGATINGSAVVCGTTVVHVDDVGPVVHADGFTITSAKASLTGGPNLSGTTNVSGSGAMQTAVSIGTGINGAYANTLTDFSFSGSKSGVGFASGQSNASYVPGHATASSSGASGAFAH
jgi:hypothetical protein